ncbi:MAG TPA: hypothetical protein VMW38_03920, partial [Terriglobia bacterium]|nr:hypothetical protein [Terriglobia bacterium]
MTLTLALFRISLAIGCLLLIGRLALRLLERGEADRFWTGRLGFSFGVGLGLVCLGMFYMAYLRVRLSLLNITLLSGGIIALLTFLNYLNPECKAHPRRLRYSHRWTLTQFLLAGIVGACILLVLIDAFSQPLLAFDARSIWGMKAKILFFQQGVYGEDFFEPARLHAHQQYPLLVPLAETFICRSLGQFNDRWERAIFPCFFIALIFLFYFVLRRSFGRTYSLAGAAMFSSLPILVIFANGNASSGYADVPLSYFLTAFVAALLIWADSGNSRYLWLASLLGACTAFTKNEGIALWSISVITFALLQVLSSAKPIARILDLTLCCSGTLILLTPWFHLRSQLVLNDENYTARLTLDNVMLGLGRLPYLLKQFLREFLLKPHLWNVFWLMVFLMLATSTSKSWRSRHTVLFVIPGLYSLLLVL